MELLDVRGQARLVGGALDEGGLDVRALDALLDVRDEEVGELVLAAARERVRQPLVGVDARREHDVEPALLRHPAQELRHRAPVSITFGSTTVLTPCPTTARASAIALSHS